MMRIRVAREQHTGNLAMMNELDTFIHGEGNYQEHR